MTASDPDIRQIEAQDDAIVSVGFNWGESMRKDGKSDENIGFIEIVTDYGETAVAGLDVAAMRGIIAKFEAVMREYGQ